VDEVDGSGWQVLGEGGTDWQADETPVAPATAFLAVR
jgi:hypothetical protein